MTSMDRLIESYRNPAPYLSEGRRGAVLAVLLRMQAEGIAAPTLNYPLGNYCAEFFWDRAWDAPFPLNLTTPRASAHMSVYDDGVVYLSPAMLPWQDGQEINYVMGPLEKIDADGSLAPRLAFLREHYPEVGE